MPFRHPFLALVLILLASAVLAGAFSPGPARLARRTDPRNSAESHPVLRRQACLLRVVGYQPGYSCVNGAVDQTTPTKPPSAAFVRDSSPGNVRHGRYSARVVLNPGDHASYTCKAEGVSAIKRLNEGEGSESWWGWSWKLPHRLAWHGLLGNAVRVHDQRPLWPSYGMLNFDAATRNSLRLGLHTGLTPNPGSGSYNSAYEKWVTLLGPGAPRPMVYGKWLDFYMHVVWRSRTNGVLQIWYRVDGAEEVHEALLGCSGETVR